MNKPAYNVRFWNFENSTLVVWENYAGGKHQHKAQNEQKAREWLACDGWEVKTFYNKK